MIKSPVCIGLLACLVSAYSSANDLWFDVSLQGAWLDRNELIALDQPLLASQLSGYVNTRTVLSAATELDTRFGLVFQHWQPEWPTGGAVLAGTAQRYRYDWFADLSWQSDSQRTQAELDLDQLKLAGYWSNSTLNIGRQAISLGIARVFPVIDVIQPNASFLGQSTYRPGVDAIRLTHYAGPLTEIDAIVVGGEGFTAAMRARTFAYGFDWEATLLNFDAQQTIAAVSVNGGMQSYGLWLETALYNNENDYNWRWTAGLDSTLGDVYWLTELHYNGLANARQDNNANVDFFTLGAVNALSEWYISAQARYGFTLLSSLTAGVQYNMDSSEWLVNAAFNTELSQAVMLQASVIVPVSNAGIDTAEYGFVPNIFSVQADWTF